MVSQLKDATKLAGKNEHVTIIVKDETELKLSDVMDSTWSLRLETTPASHLIDIDKIRFEGNDIFILDRVKGKTLERFDTNGKFITTIGKTGTGLGEYYEPTDFFVKGNEVIVYDQFKRVLNFYTIEGMFIKDRKVPFIFTSFHLFAENKFLFHAFNTDNYHIHDILGYNLLWGDSSSALSYRSAYRQKTNTTTSALTTTWIVLTIHCSITSPSVIQFFGLKTTARFTTTISSLLETKKFLKNYC